MTMSTEDLRQHLANFMLDLAKKDVTIEGWQDIEPQYRVSIAKTIKQLHDALAPGVVQNESVTISHDTCNIDILPAEDLDDWAGADSFDFKPMEVGISFSPRTCPVCHKRMPFGGIKSPSGGCSHCGQ